MIRKYHPSNWKNNIPSNIIEYLYTPSPKGLRIANFVFQKIFGINRQVNFMVNFTSRVIGNITIGKEVAKYMAGSGGCYIQGINGVEIGDYTMLAPGVKIISSNHSLKDFSEQVKTSSIKIGKHCWLAANSTILPGVQLGDNTIVAAGSVVTKSFEGNVVIAGVPAKILKKL